MELKENKGITIIALVITIIILLILAGIIITFMLGDNGILNRAKNAGETYEEQAAREKLEIALADLGADKIVDSAYNENEYINDKLAKQEMIVNGNIVMVDGWQFEMDRSVPKIASSIGRGEQNEQIQIVATSTINSDYVKATIHVEITYTGAITLITMKGENITIPTPVNNKYTFEKEVTENGKYSILAKDENGKYQIQTITITDITEDMDIWTKEDLVNFRNNVNSGRTYQGKTVRLMADIDLVGSSRNQWIPIGNYGTDTTHYFSGIFEGNNHIISNIYIDTGINYQGLFGYIKNGEIKNVKLNSGSISSTNNYVGGIVGGNENSILSECENNIEINGYSGIGGITGILFYNAKITKCTNKAIVIGIHSAGGIAGGISSSAEISECYNVGNIKTMTTGSTNSVYIAGGIVGCISNVAQDNSKVINCYNTGNVYGHSHTGGIVGCNEGGGMHTIMNCYSIGILSGTTNIYAISGAYSTWNGIPQINIINNYWLLDCGTSYGRYNNSNSGATPITDAILKTYANTLGEAYKIDSNNINNGYPILKWQSE